LSPSASGSTADILEISSRVQRMNRPLSVSMLVQCLSQSADAPSSKKELTPFQVIALHQMSP
jgi:hypothetical protein